MNPSLDTKDTTTIYLPVYLESLRTDSILDFDLYVRTNEEYVLYRASDLPFTDETRCSLLDNNVRTLHVHVDKQRNYQRYIESNIRAIIDDVSIEEDTKAGIVYENASCLVRDILDNPSLKSSIERGQDVVESTVAYVLKGQRAFHSLLRVMSYDYYTYSHCVNVCTFSLALAQASGITDAEELFLLGTGALLHDVGKTKIPEAVLNKPGPLTPTEMDLMKKHPQFGFEIVKSTDVIPDMSYYPIIQHHEREDSNGYPNKAGAGEIHIYSKMVAIADVFDAMTTRRTYRDALSTFQALKTMHESEKSFERRLLDAFTHLMGPTDR
jgi:putative nucleotidyltransferase with HDIG domain